MTKNEGGRPANCFFFFLIARKQSGELIRDGDLKDSRFKLHGWTEWTSGIQQLSV